MRVLQLTNLYPTPSRPVFGVFVREQIERVRLCVEHAGGSVDVRVIERVAQGRRAYIREIVALGSAAQSYDLVHAHHLLSGATACLANLDVPLIVSMMNAPGCQLVGLPNWLETALYRLVLHSADAIIHKSPPPYHGIDGVPTVYLPNGVDLRRFSPIDRSYACEVLAIDPTRDHLLFVSANDLHRPAKRYDRFLDVLHVLRRSQDVEPLLLVNELRERVPYFFAAASCLVVTSEHEGSPNAVKEALAMGLPIVSTDVGDVRHLVSGLPGSAVAATSDPEELARLVIGALNADSVADAYRARLVERGLDSETETGRLVGLYRKVANSGGHSAIDRRSSTSDNGGD